MPRPGPVGTWSLAVVQLERRRQDAVHERRVGNGELRPGGPVEDGDELQRRGDEHAGREAVRDDLDRGGARELGDLAGDGEAAAACDVGLEHVDVTVLDERAERADARRPPRPRRCAPWPRPTAVGTRRDRRARAPPRTSRDRAPRRGAAARARASPCRRGRRRPSACGRARARRAPPRSASTSPRRLLAERPPAELERACSRQSAARSAIRRTSSAVSGHHLARVHGHLRDAGGRRAGRPRTGPRPCPRCPTAPCRCAEITCSAAPPRP